MKKVLIITYYWPPSGGAGVQRWLKFAKYLPNFGWEPIIYTPDNQEAPSTDESLLKDIPEGTVILKTPIWEPYNLYKKFIGQNKNEKINAGFLTEKKKPGLTEKISVWIRGNWFIPDARKFWIKPSVKFLSEYLKSNPVDVIISTGPPHSMHLIAMGLKEKLNVAWIADFRDPWTNIDYYSDLMLTAAADKKHHFLEQKVLTEADIIISVSDSMTEEFKIQSSKLNVDTSKFITITNGFDDDDINKGVIIPDKKFSIAHIGTLVRTRNPEVLWKVLSDLVKNNNEFKNMLEIKLVGKVDINVMQNIDQYKLSTYINKIDYLQHSEVIKLQQQSQVLLLLINNTKNAKGILTGKFFEYLSAKRPILGIGPANGDVAKILQQTASGTMINFDDEQNLKRTILEYFTQFKSGKLFIHSKNTEKYSRKNLTQKLSEVLVKVSSTRALH